MAKDFFDEEFDKKTGESENIGGESWFDRPAPKKEVAQTKKPLYITLICVAVVLCIVFGWVLCTVFQGVGNYNTDGNGIVSYGDDILGTVIEYLRTRYYMDIDEETWLEAIEYSGTALMYKAGDRYSQLMSPQTYYDFCYPTSSTSVGSDEIFGISFVVEEGVGLYVSSVVANSAAYGKLQAGDLVLKLSDIEDKDGNAPVFGGVTFDSMVVGQYSNTAITTLISTAHKANFLVLRLNSDSSEGFELFEVSLTRQKIVPVATDYQYYFVEFYFDDEHSNVSLPSDDYDYSTYEERHLDLLPQGTGYVRLTQFMDYVKTDEEGNVVVDNKGNPVTISAADEFAEVMELFKEMKLTRLVLDLKGNPGGNVTYVSDIAGMLVTAAKLTEAQREAVTNSKGELLITTLNMSKFNYTQQYSRSSTYSNYFGNVQEKCSIVVWTDGGSASASELLTGALLDYGTAVQMGVTTYGKGIAQTWEALPFYGTVTNLNGEEELFPWAIYYTCASYFSPLGNNIHGEGYTPEGAYNYLTNYAALWNAALTYWN